MLPLGIKVNEPLRSSSRRNAELASSTPFTRIDTWLGTKGANAEVASGVFSAKLA